MLNNLTEFWYLWLAVVIALVLTLFVWYRALKASARRNGLRRAEIEKMDRQHRLRREYAKITPELIAGAADEDLPDGVTEHLMVVLENADDDLALFRTLPEEWRFVYTLMFVKELAAGDSVRRFFRECGEALGQDAASAFSAMNKPELAAFFAKAARAYDEKDMTASADEKTIAALEEEFKRLTEHEDLDAVGAHYVRANADVFIREISAQQM